MTKKVVKLIAMIALVTFLLFVYKYLIFKKQIDFLNLNFHYEEDDTEIKSKNNVYNILMWTSETTVPFVFLKNGGEIFQEEKCKYRNCYITKNQKYLPSIADFDAVIFHAPEFTYTPWKRFEKPSKRSKQQIYIFTCIESAHNYPVCSNQYDNFFNWTWTYRTTSEVKWGYVDIKDLNNSIVGPKPNMEWISDMDEVDQDTKSILEGKSKAVAWLVSNCRTKSLRETYASNLNISLQRYNLQVDIYGKCGKNKCSNMEKCHEMIKKDYYFYLSFENSFAEDYVTEKFLHAFKNYAIPLVWGGADYTRFAPPLSYLNAKEISASDMANIIYNLIQNKTEYASYFKWRNHYRYQRDIDTPDTRASCRLCQALNENNGTIHGENEKYKDFKAWWNSGTPITC